MEESWPSSGRGPLPGKVRRAISVQEGSNSWEDGTSEWFKKGLTNDVPQDGPPNYQELH